MNGNLISLNLVNVGTIALVSFLTVYAVNRGLEYAGLNQYKA